VEPVAFTTEDGVRLEGELRTPDDPPKGSAVICHAHPRHGGSKDHPVLWAVRNELAGKRGLAALVFNFRGTMGSAGAYGGGRDEVRDARAAIGFARERAEGPILVFGWSFGASVALREAFDDERVAALALIGLPVDPGDVEVPPLPSASELRAFRRPVLLVAGEGDVYAPRPRLESLSKQLPAGELLVLPGTDHFLWRREREAATAVAGFAVRALGLDQSSPER
jgi:alpha/beta superfamily hydrolase